MNNQDRSWKDLPIIASKLGATPKERLCLEGGIFCALKVVPILEAIKWVDVSLLQIILFFFFITRTCLCNVDPLEPHFYIIKLGFTGVYIIFLFLLKYIVGTR